MTDEITSEVGEFEEPMLDGEAVDVKTDDYSTEEPSENDAEDNYAEIIESDLAVLKAEFPELSHISDITELENPTRYGALRDLGLSPEEAYRAVTTRRSAQRDTRAHLRSSAPRHASSPAAAMSYRDLEIARSIFSDVSDAELQRLYKRVTK